MAPLAGGESYWVASTPETAFAALERDVEADVCVVGGGITGLLTAWELTERGRSVVLLEQRRIASSVTGYTTAKLTSQHGLRFHRIEREHGPDAAAAYGHGNERALRRIRAIAESLGLHASIQSRSAYVYSTHDANTERMRAEADAARRAGLPAHFTTEVPPPVGAVSAVRFDDQAQFHPRRLLLALATALLDRGCRIFEQSKVTAVDAGDPCVVTAGSGHVHARDVVVATLLPSGVAARLRRHVYCHQGYAVALSVERDMLSHGVFINYERPMRSLRTIDDGDGVLLQVGGSAHVADPNTGATPWDELEQWGRERFGAGTARYRWTTQDYSVADGLPLIGPAGDEHPNVFVAAGFGGWGLTTAGMSAELLTQSICDAPHAWHRHFDPRRKLPIADSSVVSAHSSSGTDVDGSARAASLSPGSAAIVEHRGEQVAAYRAPDGTLHSVSAVCTHLGGILLWDHEARRWQCPCHGSVFEPDGEVVEGPAREPLPPRPFG